MSVTSGGGATAGVGRGAGVSMCANMVAAADTSTVMGMGTKGAYSRFWKSVCVGIRPCAGHGADADSGAHVDMTAVVSAVVNPSLRASVSEGVTAGVTRGVTAGVSVVRL